MYYLFSLSLTLHIHRHAFKSLMMTLIRTLLAVVQTQRVVLQAFQQGQTKEDLLVLHQVQHPLLRKDKTNKFTFIRVEHPGFWSPAGRKEEGGEHREKNLDVQGRKSSRQDFQYVQPKDFGIWTTANSSVVYTFCRLVKESLLILNREDLSLFTMSLFLDLH